MPKIKTFSPVTFLCLLILVILALFQLHFAIKTNVYFSLDDFTVLAYFRDHSPLFMIKQFLTSGDPWGFRKITGYLNLNLIYQVFSTNPLAYLLNNHLLHTFNLILLFLISNLLSQNKLKSLFVSIIFNHYYLTYFSNVHEYLATFFVLLSTYTYLKFPRQKPASLLFFIFALLSKEIASVLPFLLLAIETYRQNKINRVKPYFYLLAFYLLYQAGFYLNHLNTGPNHPYTVSLAPGGLFTNLLFYLSPWLITFIIIITILSKKYRLFALFFTSLLSLLPALILSQRQESYYLYLPMSILLLSLALLLPRLRLKTIPLYLLLVLIFGGRQVLPLIAHQDYPNWQKVSIFNVLNRVKANLPLTNKQVSVSLADIHLERDAQIMLETGTLDMFLPPSVSKNYRFNYDISSREVKIINAQLTKSD